MFGGQLDERLADKARLPRARNAGDGRQDAEREADVEAAQVVARDALQFEPAARGPRRPGGDALLAEEVAPGLRFLHRLQPGGTAGVENAAAVLARAGPDLHDPIGGAHHVHLVLDHEEGVAGGPKLPEGAEERLRVGGMQPSRRFVEDIDDAEEVGADLRREAEPLEFAGRKSRRATIGREVAETEVEQHLDAREQVLDDALRHDGSFGMLLRDLRPLGRVAEEGHHPQQREARQIGDVQTGKGHRQRFRAQAFPVAERAFGADQVALDPLLDRRALGGGEGLEQVLARAGEGALIARRLFAFQRAPGLRRGEAGVDGHGRVLFGEEDPVAVLPRQVAPRRSTS